MKKKNKIILSSLIGISAIGAIIGTTVHLSNKQGEESITINDENWDYTLTKIRRNGYVKKSLMTAIQNKKIVILLKEVLSFNLSNKTIVYNNYVHQHSSNNTKTYDGKGIRFGKNEKIDSVFNNPSNYSSNKTYHDGNLISLDKDTIAKIIEELILRLENNGLNLWIYKNSTLDKIKE